LSVTLPKPPGMQGNAQAPSNVRPAVVDGEVVLLPTLAGLLKGETGTEGAPSRDLWSTLAAAVMAEEAFDEIESDLADGRTLADVIDMEARRPRA